MNTKTHIVCHGMPVCLNYRCFYLLSRLLACLLCGAGIVHAQILSVPTEEQPSKYTYTFRTTYERTGKIIVYFSEDSGRTCFIWEDGLVAWKENSSDKKFFTVKLEQKQVKEMIQKIKDNYEQGAERLGGTRVPLPLVTTFHGHNLDLQILDNEYFQKDFWNEAIVNYYEKHGVESIDINTDDYDQLFGFGPLSSAEEHYWPHGKKMKYLSKEDISLIVRHFKEDVNHLLSCKELIFSLLPSDRDSLETIELRIKDTEMKIALRYGARISEYRYVYTDKLADSDSLISRFSRVMYNSPKAVLRQDKPVGEEEEM